MIHKGTTDLETERLYLRKFKLDDAQSMFDNWANDAEVTRFLSWKRHVSPDISKEIIKSWINSYKKMDFYLWAIEHKEEKRLIGSISCENILETHLRGDTGYCLSKKFWNNGIMTEALKKIIDFLITEVGFKRIQAFHHIENYASGKVMLNAGMKYEGRLRKYLRDNNGKLVDSVLYAITYKDLEI